MGFLASYAPIVSAIEKEIRAFLAEKRDANKNPILDEFYGEVEKHVLSGGKRLRPLSMVMAYRAYHDDDRILRPSISSELVHSSSLILDDAMDEDLVRHGEPTFNAVYADKFLDAIGFDIRRYEKGRYWIQRDTLKELFFAQKAISRYSYALSVLGSNVMYALSLEALTRCEFPVDAQLHALELHRRMYQKLNEGQLLDILYESHRANEEEYLAMIHKKTGILFVYPLRIGLAYAQAEAITALDGYAHNMAKAFQIQDDILGSFGSERVTGKPSYSDITKGKRTLLVIKAMEHADDAQKKRLRKVLGYEHASREDVAEVRDIFRDTGAYDYCTSLAQRFVDESKAALPEGMAPASHAFFSGLADFVITRDR